MFQKVLKTPTWLLFVISIIPIVLIQSHEVVWAVGNIIAGLFYGLWFWAISSLPVKTTAFNKPKFKIRLIFTLIYFIALSIYFCFTYKDYDEPTWIYLIIIPCHLIAGYCYIFIVRYFITLLTANDINKEHNYIFYLLGTVFFPIGIWWINPKIKEIIKKYQYPRN